MIRDHWPPQDFPIPCYVNVPGHPHHLRMVEVVGMAPQEPFVLPNGVQHNRPMTADAVVARFIGQPVLAPDEYGMPEAVETRYVVGTLRAFEPICEAPEGLELRTA